MSLPRYPQYKSSGVVWLGELPAHWKVVQSRRYFKDRNERARDTDQQLTASQKHGMLYQSEFMQREGQKVTQVILGADILKHVEPNDFVISMRSFQGGLEWCGLRGSMSSAYVALAPSDSIHAPFYAHLFKSAIYIQALQATTNLVRDGQALRFSNFAQVPLPLVPIQEQQAIATFLDHETAKIDALIAAQEKLIALLAEKRQATISHAVTRGLNPDAPMKDSGVAWLGEVPGHWEVKPIGHLCRGLSYGFTNPMPTTDEGPYLLTANDIGMGNIAFETARRTSVDAFDNELTDKSRPQAGDILITKDGTLGRVALFEGAKACINQSVASLRPEPTSVQSEFVALALSGGAYQERMVFDAGGTTIKHIYISRLAKMPFALPPLREQMEIVAHLQDAMLKLKRLESETGTAAALLKERRSALIAAAVTGQIDVRKLKSDVSELEPA